jgi:hypothetical protein
MAAYLMRRAVGPFSLTMRTGASPTGVCVASLVVVGNRWVTTVIGPVRQDCS